MRLSTWQRTLALAVLVAGLLETAAAQNMGWSTITPSIAGTDTLGLVLREQMQQQQRGQRGSPDEQTLAQTTSLRFTPSEARRQQNLAAFVAKTRSVDPENADGLARLFASGDVIEKVAPMIRPMGLRIDDLGDTYALWWMSAWNATQGLNPSPSRETAQAVRAQAGRALAATPSIARANEAAKQEFAEALLVQVMFIDAAVEHNRNSPPQLRALAKAIQQGAGRMGLDLSAMKLTEAGFVPAR
ncbi:DUF6683 family protein [Aquincola tertiaricarbonis]|uniref:DUF6683 family protein n=1 Tax=Aquincola tertiaricarbonis TaxID=391953 RepID=UPI0012ED19A3|nr:DUF6683 family protein [Aquincola tertiaricarbonis]